MLGPGFIIIGAIAFFGVNPSVALTPEQANLICSLVLPNAKIANPLACNQYYACIKGKAQLGTCLGNQLFSKEAQTCVQPEQSSCGSEDIDVCANKPDGYFTAVPYSCSGFYYCKDGQGSRSNCPYGLNFDEGTQGCRYQHEFPCTETSSDGENINFCASVQNDIYFASSTSCVGWQKCEYNGQLITGNCGDEYMFNADTGSCDYKVNVVCRQVQGTPGGPSLEGLPCKVNGEVKPDWTCMGYYVCINNKYAYGKCPNGKYYNPKNKNCVPRVEAVNDCDRCEGVKNKFVNRYQDDCRGYSVCKNGRTDSVGVCPTGYFDEITGGCGSDVNPKYPVCYVSKVTESPSTEEPSDTTTKASTSNPDPEKPTTTTTTTTKPADPENQKPDAEKSTTTTTTTKPEDTETQESSTEKPDQPENPSPEQPAKPEETDPGNTEGSDKPAETEEGSTTSKKPKLPFPSKPKTTQAPSEDADDSTANKMFRNFFRW